MKLRAILLLSALAALASASAAKRHNPASLRYVEPRPVQEILASADSIAASEPVADLLEVASAPAVAQPLSPAWLGPVVFDHYRFIPDTLALPAINPTASIVPQAVRWLDVENFRRALMRRTKQGYIIQYPSRVAYNMATLPEAPPTFIPTVNPEDHRLDYVPMTSNEAAENLVLPVDVGRKNWLHAFNGAMQFSESYISPNWYQGGKGNINAIGNVQWDVKLNQAFHPKILFDTSVMYKLAANNAPDDTVHAYNISEDIFRINSKFGYKAFKNWFYSVTFVFKTQLLNNYKTNTDNLLAAFLSPGELNLGLGMSYAWKNKSETVTFDTSISPLAWNLKTCISDRIDPTTLGIKAGHRMANELGTSVECKLTWKIRSNITYTGRLFAFTDYSYLQSDWENTLKFDITRFLSTMFFFHLRYDSSTNPAPDAKWRYWQVKEILSIGFNYSFNTGA